MISATFTETFLRRDRSVVLAGLGVIILLSWAYMGYLAWDMANMMDMSDASMGMEMAMPTFQPWGIVDFFLVFIMWTVMQMAMMTPSAAPMVLTYSKINRQRHAQLKPVLGTAVFYLGYILVWMAFSATAALAQGGLHAATLLSPMMETTSPVLAGIILIAAGVFQFTPLKHACLSHCRTPLGFFMAEWREGKLGALVMGARHGAFCVGCCWLIMALLFVAGVMNLFWIAVIAAYGLALCGRCHEPVLDCRYCCLCFGRETAAGRSQSKLGHWGADDRLGRLDDYGCAALDDLLNVGNIFYIL
jgi:predicted metal-binding membrane protein